MSDLTPIELEREQFNESKHSLFKCILNPTDNLTITVTGQGRIAIDEVAGYSVVFSNIDALQTRLQEAQKLAKEVRLNNKLTGAYQ